jgi:hypothetical protein
MDLTGVAVALAMQPASVLLLAAIEALESCDCSYFCLESDL